MQLVKALFTLVLFLFCWLFGEIPPWQTYQPEFFRNFYLEGNVENFLLETQSGVTYQLEATGGFSVPNPYVFAILGQSYLWNTYTYDGLRLDNKLISGDSLIHPQLTLVEQRINDSKSGLEWTFPKSQSFLRLAFNRGSLGEPIQGYAELIKKVSGEVAAPLRGNVFPSERKAILGEGALTGQVNYGENENYAGLFDIHLGERQLFDYKETGVKSLVVESYERGFFGIKNRAWDWDFLFSFNVRNAAGMEFYQTQEESTKQGQFSFGFVKNFQGREAHFSLGTTFSVKRELPNDTYFKRNLFDLDGEGLSPWKLIGGELQNSYSLSGEGLLFKGSWGEVSWNFEGLESLITTSPLIRKIDHGLYFKTRDLQAIPISILELSSKPTAWFEFENTAKLTWEKYLPGDWLLLKSEFGLSYDGALLSEKSFSRLGWQGRAKLSLFPKGQFHFDIDLSRRNVAFDGALIRTLASDYLSGTYFAWNDYNQNLVVDANERGQVMGSFGGASTRLASDFKQPSVLALQVPISFSFLKYFNIYLDVNYRGYRDLPWLRYRGGNAWDYGTPQSIEGYSKNVFVANEGYSSYEIANYPNTFLSNGTSLWPFAEPFYAGANFGLQSSGPWWHVQLSFEAFMTTGISGLGNGPEHNSVGLLSESTANPNTTTYYAMGRLDGDRGYQGSLLLSLRPFTFFDVTAQLRYRDGQPFAIYKQTVVTNVNGNRQVVVLPDGTRGDNIFNSDFGSREDSQWNLDVQTKFNFVIGRSTLSFFLQIYNLLDVARELQEFTLYQYETQKRYALELSIPRGIRLGFEYPF